MARPKSDKETVLRAFRLESNLLKEVKKKADQQDRSLNNMVSAVLKDYVNYDNYQQRTTT